MRKMPATIALSLLLGAAACASSNISSNAAGPAPMDSSSVSSGVPVVVDNENLNDMNVYFVRNGSRVLIGHAPSMSKSTLTIPSAVMPADLRVSLVAEPLGGSSPFRVPATVVPSGQRLYWTIGTEPSMSTVSTGE
jgi:hypothetical protein